MNSKIFIFSSSSLILSLILYCQVPESEAIINGEDAKPGEFPYIVSIRNKTGNHYCAGTLISSSHVVTSVQCLYEDNVVFAGGKPAMLKPENITVVVGTLSTREAGVPYAVEKFILHPDHDITNSFNVRNDVAIIFLKGQVNTTNITSIVTDSPDPVVNGSSGIVAGWGYLSLKPSIPAIFLQKLQVKIQSKEECKNEWEAKVRLEWKVTLEQIALDQIICARPVVDDSGTCVRDAGDPLIVDNKLVGFLVGGFPCAHGVADLFSSWSVYRPWVEKAIAGEIK